MALTKVTSGMVNPDPTNASNLSSGSVPLAQLGNVDTTGLEDDVALLGFKVASNGSLAKYNLVDQTIDDFQDASGVDASASSNEIRNTSGKYYSGLIDNSLTGGTETSYEDSGTTYIVNTFTANGDLVVPATTTISAIMVGGGGEGGSPIDYRVFNLQPALMPGVAYANVGKPEGMKGGGLGDVTLARLEPGEFVVTKKAVDNVGAQNLYKMMKQWEGRG